MTTAAYARYSTDKQNATSAEDQLRVSRAYCQRQGWPMPKEYRDDAVSGSIPVMSRPGARALMADASFGEFDTLILESLDRFSRDVAEGERMVRRLEFLGIRLIGLTDGYDSRMGMRKINRLARGMVNEMFLDDLRTKTHRGLSGQFERGYATAGACYGYRSVKSEQGSKLEIDPAQAKWVVWVFEKVAAGWSCQSIAAELNRLKVKSPRNNIWRASALFGSPRKGCGILNNGQYIGELTWNRSQWVKDPDTGKRTRRERPEGEWLRHSLPELRIVSQDVWETVRTRFGAERHQGGGKGAGRKPRTLFGGLMRCALCNGAMIAVSARQYGCVNRKDAGKSVCRGVLIGRRHADALLISHIRDMLASPEALEALQATLGDLIKQEGQGDEKRAAQARLGILNAEIGRLVEAIAAVGLSEAVRARLREAETEKMALSRTLNAPARRPLTVAELMGDYEQLLAQLESALTENVEEARAILRQVLGEVLIEPDEEGVSVNIYTNPAPALAAKGGPPIEVAGTRFVPVRLVKLKS